MSILLQFTRTARTALTVRRKTFPVVAGIFLAVSLMAQAASARTVDFSLRSIDGATVSTGSVSGKVVVLVFGATWLPISRTQVQGVQKLANKYGARGVEVYWVSTDSESAKSKNYASDDSLRAFAAKQNLKVSILRDPDGAISKRAFNVTQVPSIVILNRQGNITATLNGYDANSDLGTQLSTQLDKIL